MRVILAILAASSQLSCAAQPDRGGSKLIREVRPGVEWEQKAVIGDCNCDGKDDKAFLGGAAGMVCVGVVLTGSPAPQVLEYAVNPGAQDGVCSDAVTLALESQDYDPADAGMELQGFSRSTTCAGLVLADQDCDAVHMYWNRVAARMDWWRR
jgi:hypothetical protein